MAAHPNKTYFLGVLALVDEPSDKAPCGTRSHRILLTRSAVVAALPTLIGMGVNLGTDKHRPQSKIGFIEHAEIRGNEILVDGYVFARDHSTEIKSIRACAEEWGLSYEACDAHVNDMRQSIWTISRITFTGASIVLRDKAAYRRTEFVLL